MDQTTFSNRLGHLAKTGEKAGSKPTRKAPEDFVISYTKYTTHNRGSEPTRKVPEDFIISNTKYT